MSEMPRKPIVGEHAYYYLEHIGHAYAYPAHIVEVHSESVLLRCLTADSRLVRQNADYGKTWRFADETSAPEFEDYVQQLLDSQKPNREYFDMLARRAGYADANDPRISDSRIHTYSAPVAERKPRELTDEEAFDIFPARSTTLEDTVRKICAAYEAMRPGLLEGGQ